MEEYKEIIFDYLESKSSYGLLLNGEWGIGKTHFINKDIIEELEKKKTEKNQLKIVPIYVSLYGIVNIVDLKKKINFAILRSNRLRKLFKKHISIVRGISNIGKGFENVASNFIPIKGLTYGIEELMSIIDTTQLSRDNRNIVLFVDDLERLGEGLNINDCLGLIHTDYMEKMKCKVVFIANEEEIKDKEEFNKIKEKTIDKTVQFIPKSKDILRSILKETKNEFLEKNSEWVCDIIIFYHDPINIRTFYSIINNFDDIENKLKKIKVKDVDFQSNSIQKSLFLNTMVITETYKRGKFTKNDFGNLDYNVRRLNRVIYDKSSKSNSEIVKRTTEIYENNIHPEFSDNMFYFDVINSYILSSAFNENKFLESYQSWKIAFQKIPNLDYYQKLYDFRRMNDEEIKERQEAIIESIVEDKYEFEDLLRIYKLFLGFENMNLLFIENTFKKIFNKKIQEKYLELDDDSSTKSIFLLLNEDRDFAELSVLENKLKMLSSKRKEKESLKLIEAIFEENSEILFKYRGNGWQYSIFSSLSDELSEKYLFNSNNKADIFWQYIKGNYTVGFANSDIYEKEIHSLKKLISKIENQDKTNMEKVDQFKLKQLLESLKELAEV